MKRGENWFLEIWKNFSLEIFFGDMENFEKKIKKNFIVSKWSPWYETRRKLVFRNLKIFHLKFFSGTWKYREKIRKKFIDLAQVFPEKIFHVWNMSILNYVSNVFVDIWWDAFCSTGPSRCLRLLLDLQFQVSWKDVELLRTWTLQVRLAMWMWQIQPSVPV